MGNPARGTRAPLLAAGLYASLLFPPEFSVNVGTLRLSSYRLVLLFAMPILLLKLLSGRSIRPHAVDYLIIAHAFWAMLALIVYAGPVDGVESGGIFVIETLGAYLVARMSITNADQYRAIVPTGLSIIRFSTASSPRRRLRPCTTCWGTNVSGWAPSAGWASFS